MLSPADIAQPIRSLVRDHPNVDVLMDEAVGFDLSQQRVQLKTGVQLEYDYLVIATGSTHSYFGRDEWSKLAPGLKTVEDATEIRRRVLLAFELAERADDGEGNSSRAQLRDHWRRSNRRRACSAPSVTLHDSIWPATFGTSILRWPRFLFWREALRFLPPTPTTCSRKRLSSSINLGLEVRTGAHVTDVQPGYVMVGDERIDAVVTLWAAGVQASPLGKLLGVETDKRGLCSSMGT